jgi:hypothetical protein
MTIIKKSRSFSEGHIDVVRPMPRILSNLQSLLPEEGSATPPSPPLQSQPSTPNSSELWTPFLLRWSLRFSVHLSLVAIFETLFFWLFVSKTEDSALIHLVNTMSTKLLAKCSTLTNTQKVNFLDLVDIFINQTRVQSEGMEAATARAAYNNGLRTKSWLYVGGLVGLVGGLSGTVWWKRVEIHWKQLWLENLALILLLGVYEFMFFSTVVYPYESISLPELEQGLLTNIDAIC